MKDSSLKIKLTAHMVIDGGPQEPGYTTVASKGTALNFIARGKAELVDPPVEDSGENGEGAEKATANKAVQPKT